MEGGHLLVDVGMVAAVGLIARSADRAERDGIGADAGGSVVDGDGFREGLHRGLGRRIGQRPAHRALCLVGGDVHDRPTAAVGQEVVYRRVAPADREGQVRRNEVEDFGRGGGGERGIAEDGRVVDPPDQGRRSLGPHGRLMGDLRVAGIAGDELDR